MGGASGGAGGGSGSGGSRPVPVDQFGNPVDENGIAILATECRPGVDCSADPGPSAYDVAQLALDSVDFEVPTPQTSPPGRQITGLRTWFWVDADEWRPVTAHAEIPGLWASVTVTPTSTRWTPGDGGPTVSCDGPGRPHPGTSGARTDCGHTYTDVGDYTLTIAVTYAVTWTSSTGAGGTLAPVTLTTDVAIHVEQRQAVVS